MCISRIRLTTIILQARGREREREREGREGGRLGNGEINIAIHPFKNEECITSSLYVRTVICSRCCNGMAFSNSVDDPSAGSPMETLLRLLLPLNDQV